MTKAKGELAGIRPRGLKDFYTTCNEPGSAIFQPDAQAFMKIWCSRCRRSECTRAKGYAEAWQSRMEKQVEYLINDPVFSNLATPEHQAFAQMAFASLEAKARRLEIAARRQDWTLPESLPEVTETAPSPVPATDPEVTDPEVTEHVLADPEVTEHVLAGDVPEESADDVLYETQYPSTDRRRTYRVVLRGGGQWSCECAGWHHRQRCRHITAVRAWYEDTEPALPEATPAINTTPRGGGGVLVGRQPETAAVVDDPWALKQAVTVPLGATVVVKGAGS